MFQNALFYLVALLLLVVLFHCAVFLPGKDRGLDKPRSLRLFGKTLPFRITNVRNKRYWKSLDYVWLFLFAVGVVTAVGKARQIDAAVALEGTKREMIELLSVFDPTEYADVYGTCSDVPEMQLPISECEWIRKVAHAIDKARLRIDWPLDPSVFWGAFASEYPPAMDWGPMPPAQKNSLKRSSVPTLIPVLGGAFKTIRPTPTIDELKSRLIMVESLKRIGLKNQAITKETAVERRVLQLWPVIVILALALRWTKVTGERRLEAA